MYNMPKVPIKPLAITLEEQSAIPLINPKSTGKRLVTGKPTAIAGLPVLMAAFIATWFSLNALAADPLKSTGTPPVAASGTGGEHKLTVQERIERMKSMTPEQQIHERESMRQEMENMSPEQRAKQRKEMRMQIEKLPPEERRVMREQFRDDLDSMPPEERSKDQNELGKQWDSMTPEQRAKRRQEMREHWEQMSPEERDQIHTRMKEHWKSMPPEQREERRKEMREHFKNMSPEERQQFKIDMDMLDGMPTPNIVHPGSKDVGAGSSAKG
jgi:hypothetical protein